MNPSAAQKGIAIIGMGCRFPGAANPQEFWQMLSEGRAAFESMPPSRKFRHNTETLQCDIGSFLTDPYSFDNQYFNISPEEALVMDPQQRIMLELIVETFENAAYVPLHKLHAGVFIGADHMSYEEMLTSVFYREKVVEYIRNLPNVQLLPEALRTPLLADLEALRRRESLHPHALVGNLTNMIAGRISNEFDFTGPSMTIDTACSSALTAVHLACESLYQRQCDLAFAGGINLNLTPSVFQYMEAGKILSASKRSVPFSVHADGILLGEGAGMILLKRLDDALAAGDPIRAVIRGSGVNNDGRSISIMAPNRSGQLALLRSVYETSGYDPASISALEAHGTSARIGDAIEMSTIEQFYPRQDTVLSVGSVKSNIGHLLGAAGIAGVIKMLLAMQHKQLPPSLHDLAPNPKWRLADKNIKIQPTLEDWNPPGLRCAGVNAFGFGGANAHLILEEYPEAPAAPRSTPRTVFNRHYFCYDFFPQLRPEQSSLFQIKWRVLDVSGCTHGPRPAAWLLFCPDESVYQVLRQALGEAVPVIRIRPGAVFTRLSEREFELDAAHSDHIRWLLSGFEPDAELGIMYAGYPSGDTVREAIAVQQLFKNAVLRRGPTPLYACTFRAFAVQDSDEPADPAQRALFTLLAGAIHENPGLQGRLADFGSPADMVSDAGSLQIFLDAAIDQAVIVRDGKLLTPSIEPCAESVQAGFVPQGTCVVVGGSTGIGSRIAAYLCKKNAAAVVLTGSRPLEDLPEETSALLGENVRYIQADATNRDAMIACFREIFEQHGRIEGVFFAAGSIAYGSLAQKDPEAVAHTLRVKIDGVQNLAASIRDGAVGFVYLMSSVSALTHHWNKGMADYGAANAFLDAFAARQNTAEQRWISCAWGPWDDTGMAKGLSAVLQGWKPEEALSLLNRSLAAGVTQPIAARPEITTSFSWHFERQAKKERPAPAANTTGVQVADISYAALLRQLISEATGLQAQEIGSRVPFTQLGLDSLSAVDVIKKFEIATELDLNPTLLFEYDTLESLTRYLENLKHPGAIASRPAPAVTKVPTQLADIAFPLLPAQQTFFANHVFYPDAPCNMLARLDLDWSVDPDLLQKTWNRLVQHFETLRLYFEMSENGPVQRVGTIPNSAIEFHVFDTAAAAQRLDALEETLVNRKFVLDRAPLHSLVCVQYRSGQSTLLLVMHHIVADAWSISLIIKKLLTHYASPELRLEPDEGRFVPYLNDFLQKKTSPGDDDYWRKELHDAPSGLALPFLPEDDRESGWYNTFISHFDESESQHVFETARQCQATPFQVLLAAYFRSLQQSSAQDDIVIRLAAANRNEGYAGIESMAGCLADSLPLRIDLRQTPDFAPLVQTVKNKLLEHSRHPALPALEIAHLGPARLSDGPVGVSPAGMSFVNFDFILQNAKPQHTDIRCRTALPFTEISLIAWIFNKRLSVSWNFNTRRLSRESVALLDASFRKTLFSNKQKQEYAKTQEPAVGLEMPLVRLYPEAPLLHEKVFRACDVFADNTAVRFEAQDITYRELKQRSIQTANALVLRAASGSEVVGILAYPGIQAVYGILGILAAGKAFVPLDPDWPEARIADIIAHSGIDTLVTTAAYMQKHGRHEGIAGKISRVVLLDELPGFRLPPYPVRFYPHHTESADTLADPGRILTAADPAYVMYTSGTSGKPKGVLVQHCAVEIFLNWIAEAFRPGPNDRFIHTSSLGFGGSIRQIFSTLLVGGEIHPIPRAGLKDPQSLLEFLSRNRITLLNTVPTVLNNLIEYVEETGHKHVDLSHLRLVLVGGEALFAETVKKWRRCFGAAQQLVNLYGSTETIVNATVFFVDETALAQGDAVPIGRPRKGSLVALLDENGAFCRPGTTGEIYVGGPSIAREYYREPALSAESFVRLDLPGLAAGIYYKTGDLAQTDPSGLFHYLGRNDQQIQLYGNRVELIEVENAIFQTGKVKRVAVLDFTEKGKQWMTAFIQLNKGVETPSDQYIRNFVAERLPAYMVPQQVAFVDNIPLNHAGKIDRKALRAQYAPAIQEPPRRAPATPTESTVWQIWKDVLRHERFGLYDDFFAAGGDSIRALEVLYKLRRQFSEIPKPVALFRHRTVQQLAALLDQLNPQATKLPLSFVQKGFAAAHTLRPGTPPVWVAALPLTGDIRADFFQKAFDYLLERHAMMRTVFETTEGQLWQKILPVHHSPVETTDLSQLEVAEQQRMIAESFEQFKKTPFVLSAFPLFKLRLYRCSGSRSVLVMALHHILGDAWSLQVLMHELLRCYEQLEYNPLPSLPAPAATYADVVAYWQQQAPGAGQNDPARWQYWNDRCAGLQPLRWKQTPEKIAGEDICLLLDRRVKDQLKALATASFGGFFNLMLTLFARVIGQLTGSSDFLIGTSLSGRDVPVEDADKIVGCFARSIPLRIRLKNTSLQEETETVQETFIQTVEQEDEAPGLWVQVFAARGDQALFQAYRLFFSFMDFSALPAVRTARASVDWENAQFFFNTGSMRSDLMLGVMVTENSMRLNFYGETDIALREHARQLFFREIENILPAENNTALDAALIAYLPSETSFERWFPHAAGNTVIARQWLDRIFPGGKPRLVETELTRLGRSGLILLPVAADALGSLSRQELLSYLTDAADIAVGHGARYVSMAGMLPAHINYGYALQQEWSGREGIPVLSTGHACTVVAVLKTIEKVLVTFDLDPARLKIAVLGFGSIGQAVLSLFLQKKGVPASVLIVDLESQLPHLQHAIAHFQTSLNGVLHVGVVRDGQLPDALYEADLVVGASSSGNILEVQRLKPGAVLVDDSFPAVAPREAAIRRMQHQKDVLLTGAGKLDAGDKKRIMHLEGLPEALIERILSDVGDAGLPACRIESLLLHHQPDIPPTLGLVQAGQCNLFWQLVDTLGIEAVPFHWEGYVVKNDIIENLRKILGAHASTAK